MAGKTTVPATSRVVLSVSDKTQMDEELWRWLHQKGVVLLRANSTARALDLFAWGRIDAVVTNLRRSEGTTMNQVAGLQLTRAIRKINASVPILIYTAGISAATRAAATQAGATVVATMPGELRLGLRKALGF